MNAKTSKLLHRYALATRTSLRAVKRTWQRYPAHLRHALRLQLTTTITPTLCNAAPSAFSTTGSPPSSSFAAGNEATVALSARCSTTS